MDVTLEPGTFAPAPNRASTFTMAMAQGRMETKLILSHGEQMLLNLIVPLAILIIASLVPIFGDNTDLNSIVPLVLAVAATSAGFTGQAISVAFDRRYGALKRSAASGVPARVIIIGKIIAVASTALIQVLVLGIAAYILGWRVDALEIIVGLITLIIGVASFTAWGLLMGGTLTSEVVLAISNLIWVILLAVVGWVVYSGLLLETSSWLIIPSVSLAAGLAQSFAGTIPWIAILILIAWGAVGTWAATRFFKFDS